jgi:exodeoxyribonuclease VII small subunit
MTEAKLDIATMPFEAALAESIRLYERGEALKKRCDELLRNAEMRIEKITLSPDGDIKGVAPLDEE